jgi:hypothetical protein
VVAVVVVITHAAPSKAASRMRSFLMSYPPLASADGALIHHPTNARNGGIAVVAGRGNVVCTLHAALKSE